MKVIIEIMGEHSAEEMGTLEKLIRDRGFDDTIPGDGFVLSQQEGKPPRIAYLNRRIFRPDPHYHKMIFEIGVASESASPKINFDVLKAELQEFVIRRSAVFARPELAANELTKFFIKHIGG